MTKKKRLVLILGDQLDLQGSALRGFDRETYEIFIIESAEEAQYVWTHKAKIALFLSAMRHFAQVLEADGYPLHYLKASSLSITEALRAYLLEKQIKYLVCTEPGEWRLKQSLKALAKELAIEIEMREDEHFFCTHHIRSPMLPLTRRKKFLMNGLKTKKN
jgi:deoxyribodipyrimidine photolyase-related protein